MSESAEELARARVDLIVTAGGTATLAAAKATKEIPIVAITGSDLVKAGLAASLARPGGNVTGVSNLSLDLAGKRVQLMQELVRGMSRLGLLFAPESSVGAANLRETEDAARTLGLQTLVTVMRKPEDAEEAIAKLVQWRAEALLVVPSTMLSAQSERIAGLATKHRLPAAAGSTRFAEAGGTLSYGPDPRGEFVKAAAYAHRILTGAKAGDLPIDRASRFELVVNLRTAKAIGLSIPQSILLRASRVIE
jgi:putative ABC transport system substrate-binding protein